MYNVYFSTPNGILLLSILSLCSHFSPLRSLFALFYSLLLYFVLFLSPFCSLSLVIRVFSCRCAACRRARASGQMEGKYQPNTSSRARAAFVQKANCANCELMPIHLPALAAVCIAEWFSILWLCIGSRASEPRRRRNKANSE